MEVDIIGTVKGINIKEEKATMKIELQTDIIKDTEIMELVGSNCKITMNNIVIPDDQSTLEDHIPEEEEDGGAEAGP